MKYIIDGFDMFFPTLREAKEHLKLVWTKEEARKDFYGGGCIQKYNKDVYVGYIEFEFNNGKFKFKRLNKE